MKLIARQKIWLAIVLATNLALWIMPSDVVEQIARDRPTMLGRYSRTHFSWNIAIFVISLISFYVDWSTGATYKRRWFQVLIALLVLVPTLGLVDFALRTTQPAHYTHDEFVYHRPPFTTFPPRTDDPYEVVDRPRARRTYPNAPRGYPTLKCRLRTDRLGFRNAAVPQRCDVLVLGDSFAEGSNVSDAHTWPRRLARRSGLSVYNLGMSGYDPAHYAAALNVHGLALTPRYVVCLLYEGNDFRSARSDRKRRTPRFKDRVETYFKQSPLINAVDALLINTFGPIRADAAVRGSEMFDWLPIAIPEGPRAKHYAFAPKQLRDVCKSAEGFATHRYWTNVRAHLEAMDRACRASGARFILAYAPTKAHVTLPAVADRLPADHVRAFTKISYNGPLPEPEVFLDDLVEAMGARQRVVAAWAAEATVPFISLTQPLRQAALSGRQVFFTYDQHWTPDGHRVVALALTEFLSDLAHPAVDAPLPPQADGAGP